MSYTMTMTETKSPRQKTPKGYEIPVPKRDEFLENLSKVAKPSRRRRPKK